MATGNPVAGKFHLQKAMDKIRQLENWLQKNPAASPGDRAAAENVLKDMKNAVSGK